jgi:membrane protein
MPDCLRIFGRAVRRVYPGSSLYAQALAFNMFLTFFPMLLFFVGLLAKSRLASTALTEMLSQQWVLPPGSRQIVFEYLQQHSVHPAKWLFAGTVGTLLAGTQCMSVLIDSFHSMERDYLRPSFWRQRLRSLALLCLALGPTLAAVILTVFGGQLRKWLAQYFGLPGVVQVVWLWVALGAAFLLALIILALLYRVGQPRCRTMSDVLPGAALATGLWWVVNICFGIYVRHTPYSPIYGGLAAVIGLMVWMQISAGVVLLGAAFNAERLYSPQPDRRMRAGDP